jgi:hypothetical protein
MANLTEYPSFLSEKNTFSLASDFHNFATGQDGWTSLVVDAGTSAAVNDARGGILTLTTAATDNNEVMVRSTTELFLPTTSRPMFCRARINLTQANTDDANFFFGFGSAMAADFLVDNGGDPRTTGSIFGITCSDGDTVLHAFTRNGATATDTATTISNTDATGVYREWEVQVQEFSATQCLVTFLVDGYYLRDDTVYANVIEHRVLYASLTEMNFGIYCKAGSANSETPLIDWAIAGQAR